MVTFFLIIKTKKIFYFGEVIMMVNMLVKDDGWFDVVMLSISIDQPTHTSPSFINIKSRPNIYFYI